MDSMDMSAMATSMAPVSTPTPAPTMAMHGSGGDTVMGMSAMSMTFFHSASTPLFWDWWKPSGPQQYAATCVFLVALAAVTRVLFAVRPLLHARAASRGTADGHHRLPLHHDEQTTSRHHATAEELLSADEKTSPSEADPETAAPKRVARVASSWWSSAAVSERLLRASCEAVLVCLGYFLMLAVMTMNTGYFLSVLGGVFLGMFLVGGSADDSTAGDRWHQC
ncbi:hypothetical protein RB595_008310 [Gaeumannomyces hyphopodioides]